MDIRTLTFFRHLAGTLHFARTSLACHITPSALTRVIQRLEADLGETLFIRDNRSVELTPAGRTFLDYAEDVIRRYERLKETLSQDDMLRGQLFLYGSVTAALSILPEIIGRYRSVHPKVQIRLETGDPAKALPRLISRSADAVIAVLPDKPPEKLSFLNLRTSPLVFIASRHFPDIIHRKDGRVDWEKTPLVLADVGVSRERMDQWLADNRVVPNIYSRVSGHEAIIALVNLGCGIGLVPRLVLDYSPLAPDIRILENAPRLADYKIGLCTTRKNLSNPKVKALWDLASPP